MENNDSKMYISYNKMGEFSIFPSKKHGIFQPTIYVYRLHGYIYSRGRASGNCGFWLLDVWINNLKSRTTLRGASLKGREFVMGNLKKTSPNATFPQRNIKKMTRRPKTIRDFFDHWFWGGPLRFPWGWISFICMEIQLWSNIGHRVICYIALTCNSWKR